MNAKDIELGLLLGSVTVKVEYCGGVTGEITSDWHVGIARYASEKIAI